MDAVARALATKALEAPAKRGPGRPRKSEQAPNSSMEMALLCRQHVRSMIGVLVRIAQDENQSPAARVSAAKEIMAKAVLERSALDLIDDDRLRQLAGALVAQIREEQKTYEPLEGLESAVSVPTAQGGRQSSTAVEATVERGRGSFDSEAAMTIEDDFPEDDE